MNEQLINAGLHSKEGRIALTKMVMRLFDLWQIPTADQSVLFKHSLRSIRRYRKGGYFADDKDMLDRVGNLLIIHKCLRILYPHNRDLVYQWIVAKNKTFDGQTPIDLMKNGLNGIIAVRGCLDFQINR